MDYKVYQITKKEMFRYAAVYILADVLISILPFCACSRGFSAGHLFLFQRSQKRTGKEKKKTAGAGISGRDAVCFYRPDGGIFG